MHAACKQLGLERLDSMAFISLSKIRAIAVKVVVCRFVRWTRD